MDRLKITLFALLIPGVFAGCSGEEVADTQAVKGYDYRIGHTTQEVDQGQDEFVRKASDFVNIPAGFNVIVLKGPIETLRGGRYRRSLRHRLDYGYFDQRSAEI